MVADGRHPLRPPENDLGLRYAVIGTGAVGGFHGGRLAAVGRDVRFLLRGDFVHVRDHGLTVHSPGETCRLPQVRAYGDAADLPPCDVVLVCLKTTANDGIAQLVGPALTDGTVVVLMQNGLDIERPVAAATGRPVAGGICFLLAEKTAPGVVTHYGSGSLTLGLHGQHPPAVHGRLAQVAADFVAAGVPCKVTGQLRCERFRKLVWNVPYNGLSVATGKLTDTLVAEPAVHEVRALMREVQAVAAAHGCAIGDAFLDEMVGRTASLPPYAPSMKVDFDRGRPLEIAALYGNLLVAAAQAGVPAPRIRMLTCLLQVMDPT